MGSGLFALPSGKPLPVQKTLGPWSYVGYTSVDGTAGAVLENKAEHQGRSIQVGDVVEEAAVTGISAQNIRMTRKGKAFLLQQTDPTEAPKAAPVTPPPPGAPPTSSPSPTPPPGNAPPSGPTPSSGPTPPALPPPAVAPAPSPDSMKVEKSAVMRKG
jgi:hypothetical protein